MDIRLTGLTHSPSDVTDPGHAETQPGTSDGKHSERRKRHFLLGLEVVLLAVIIFTGSIGGNRATRQGQWDKMNPTHVIGWLVCFWFGSLSVTAAICLR